MKGSHSIRCCLLVLPILLLALKSGPVHAGSDEWVPELLPTAEASYRGNSDPVRIGLPENTPEEVLQRLGLELDAIDVTAMATYQDGVIAFAPMRSLAYGMHVLRLVEYADDGSILERGYWKLDIRQSEHYRQASFGADINLTASQRVADKGLSSPRPGRLQGQGGASLAGAVAGDRWTVDMRGDLLYDSLTAQTANGNQLDLGNYLVTVSAPSSELRIGHHSIPENNLILDNFNRRGVSADIDVDGLRSVVTGFSMRSEQITGFRSGLGVTDPDNRVSGVLVHSRPLHDNPERLDLLFSWLDGTGSGAGLNVIDDGSRKPGTAWSVVADSALLSQQLRLRGEYAGSDFDMDGSGSGFAAEKDRAWSLLARYAPIVQGASSNWNIGAEHLNVGTFFRSLGNNNLAPDRQMSRLFGGVDAASWNLAGSVAREVDNLDDNALLPTTRTWQGYTSLTYSAYEQVSESSAFSWMGTPSHTLTLGYVDQQETETPAGSTLPPTDRSTASVNLQSTFSYSGWNWGGGLGWQGFRDRSGLAPDSNTLSASLNAAFPLGERVYLSPDIRVDSTRALDTGVRQHTLNWGLTAGIRFIPEKLDGNFSLRSDRNLLTGDPLSRQDDTTLVVSGDIVWHWLPARENRPGFDISLNGIWNNVNNDVMPALDETGNQVFLNLVMTLPVAAPGGLQ